jgi:hypothetical protein
LMRFVSELGIAYLLDEDPGRQGGTTAILREKECRVLSFPHLACLSR